MNMYILPALRADVSKTKVGGTEDFQLISIWVSTYPLTEETHLYLHASLIQLSDVTFF